MTESEDRLLPGRWVAALLGAFLLTMGLVLVGSRALVHSTTTPGQPRPQPLQAVPPPRLDPQLARDLAALRRREQARLATWEWVDRERGIAHMPVDEAARLIAERGRLPRWPEGDGVAHWRLRQEAPPP